MHGNLHRKYNIVQCRRTHVENRTRAVDNDDDEDEEEQTVWKTIWENNRERPYTENRKKTERNKTNETSAGAR